jgi:hypothetical protein
MSSTTDTFSRFFQPENVLLKEIIEIIKDISSSTDLKLSCIFIKICKGTFRTIALIVLKHYIDDTQMLLSLLKKFFWYIIRIILYKKRTYDLKAHQSTLVGEGSLVNGLPIYVEKSTSSLDVIYAKGIHSSYLQQIDEDARNKSDLENAPHTKFYAVLGQRYSLIKPMSYFPSKNYLKLQNIIQTYCKVNDNLLSYNVLGILIDGEPGLGKSKFADFIATRRLLGEPGISNVYRVDMSSNFCLKMAPETIFNSFFHEIAIKQSSLFMIDEVDKYLSYFIEDSYSKVKQNKKEEEEIPTFDDYSYKIRVDFLYMLLGILERIGNESSCIVMFCSNNFETIFGDLEMTHFHSLNSRFMRVKFERCDRDEIEDYLRYLNEKFRNDEELYEEEIDNILLNLNPNISITYRSLNEITVLNSYSIRKIVDALNQYITPPSSPKTGLSKKNIFTLSSEKITKVVDSKPPPPSSSEPEKISKVFLEPEKNSKVFLEPEKITKSLHTVDDDLLNDFDWLTIVFITPSGGKLIQNYEKIQNIMLSTYCNLKFYMFSRLGSSTSNIYSHNHHYESFLPKSFSGFEENWPSIVVLAIRTGFFEEILKNKDTKYDIERMVVILNGRYERHRPASYAYYNLSDINNYCSWLREKVLPFFKIC